MFCASLAIAQSPNDFFEQGFVTGKSHGQVSSQSSSQGEPSSSSASSEDIFSDKSGKKVLAIGVIVNQQPWDTAIDTLGTLRDLIARFDISGGDVQIIGNETEIGPRKYMELRSRLGMLGAQVSVVREPSKQYQVVQSPTWIIHTTEGRYLLEGLPNPRRYLNSKGEFIEP